MKMVLIAPPEWIKIKMGILTQKIKIKIDFERIMIN